MYQDLFNSFYESSNPDKAVSMKTYMKNQFEFLGIQTPERTRLSKEFMKSIPKSENIDWVFVEKCWELPEREFQYLALDYLIKSKGLLKADDILRVREMITTKSWWDTVDLLASHLVGGICLMYPEQIMEHVLSWSQSENLWLRRTAILFQLKYKEKTDTVLLAEIIGYNQECEEFFIAKAIGWMLREYSKTDPDWVSDFIETHQLRKLSIREGSKYI